jgi:hypothetical protein
LIAALIAAWKARKWLPYVAAGGAGLIVGLLVAAGAWSWQANKIDGLTIQRDTFQARAIEQAAGNVEARRVVESQRQTIKGLTSLWHSTREQAERVAAETQARGASLARAERKLKELSHADADPADVAIHGLECMRAIEAGNPAAACAGSD